MGMGEKRLGSGWAGPPWALRGLRFLLCAVEQSERGSEDRCVLQPLLGPEAEMVLTGVTCCFATKSASSEGADIFVVVFYKQSN